jgi:hypothetical protein
MRHEEEEDVYSIDTEDSPETYSIDKKGGFEQQLLSDYDLTGEAAVGPKKSGLSCRDERKSCRFQVPEGRQSCELKVGASLLPAMLVDESKGGFAVLIERLEGLKSGKKVALRTDLGWCKVRIIYVRKAAPPANSDAKSDCWFRLGLRKARSFFLF